jgi:hypothetical protein
LFYTIYSVSFVFKEIKDEPIITRGVRTQTKTTSYGETKWADIWWWGRFLAEDANA